MAKISVGNIFWNLRADGTKLPADVKKAIATSKKQLERTGGQFKQTGKKLSAGLTAPLTGLGLVSVKFARDFKEVMLDVNKNVKGLDSSNIKAFEGELLKIGSNSFLGAEGIARLASEGGKLGKAREGALEFAKAAEEIAVAFDFGRTVEGAEEAGRAVGKLESGFKITTSQVRDLADAINHFGDNTASNAKNITNILVRQGATIANTTGLARSEIAALAATIDAAAPSAEVAATGMKNFIGALTKGNAATDAQSARLAQLGFDAEELAERMQTDATGAILDVLNALKKLDPAVRNANLSKIFGEESKGAIAPLLGNLEALEKNLKKAGDSANFAGAVKAEFDRLNESDVGKIERALSAIKVAGISLGTAILPPLASVVSKLGEVAQKIGVFFSANPQFAELAVTLGIAAAALGPLVAGIGFVLTSFAGALPILTGMTAGVGGLTGVFGLLATALTGPVAIAIGAFIGAGILIAANWERIRNAVGAAINWIVGHFESWKERNADTIASLSSSWESIKESANRIFTAMRGAMQLAISKIDDFLQPIGGLQGAWGIFNLAVQKVWDEIGNTISGSFAFISRTFSTIADVLTGQQTLWDGFKSVVSDAVSSVGRFLVSLKDKIVSTFKNIDLKKIGIEIMNGLKEGIKQGAQNAVNAAANAARDIKNKITGFFDVRSPSRVLKEIGGFLMEGLGLGITDKTGMAVLSAQNAASKIKGALATGLAGASLSVASPTDSGIGGLAGRDNFSQDGFGSIASQYIPETSQIQAKFIAEREAILNETRITEDQRTALLQSSDSARNKALAGNKQDFLGQLANMQNSHDTRMQGIGRAAAIAQAAIQKKGALHEAFINTKAMAIGAYKALAPIPIIGPVLGIAAAAAATAYGASQIGGIKSQGAFAEGGDFIGNRSMLVGEEGPELIVPRSQGTVLTASETASLGKGGNGSGVTVIQNFHDATPERLREMATEIEERAKAGVVEAVTNQGPERDAFRF